MMSVDHDANYGIGYQVVANEDLDDTEDLEDGLDEYIRENMGDGFEVFESGAGSYTGDDNDVYIAISNPFKNTLDLSKAKQNLDNEVARLNLEPQGEFGLVGGLLVW